MLLVPLLRPLWIGGFLSLKGLVGERTHARRPWPWVLHGRRLVRAVSVQVPTVCVHVVPPLALRMTSPPVSLTRLPCQPHFCGTKACHVHGGGDGCSPGCGIRSEMQASRGLGAQASPVEVRACAAKGSQAVVQSVTAGAHACVTGSGAGVDSVGVVRFARPWTANVLAGWLASLLMLALCNAEGHLRYGLFF